MWRLMTCMSINTSTHPLYQVRRSDYRKSGVSFCGGTSTRHSSDHNSRAINKNSLSILDMQSGDRGGRVNPPPPTHTHKKNNNNKYQRQPRNNTSRFACWQMSQFAYASVNIRAPYHFRQQTFHQEPVVRAVGMRIVCALAV